MAKGIVAKGWAGTAHTLSFNKPVDATSTELFPVKSKLSRDICWSEPCGAETVDIY